MDFDTLRKGCKISIFFFIVNNSQIDNTHRLQLIHNLLGGQTTVMCLATRHGNRIIIQDFIGNIGARSQRRTDRHHA